MPEHIGTQKVYDRIKKDGFNAGRQAIEKATKELTDRGFDRAEILPIIKEGVADAIKE